MSNKSQTNLVNYLATKSWASRKENYIEPARLLHVIYDELDNLQVTAGQDEVNSGSKCIIVLSISGAT